MKARPASTLASANRKPKVIQIMRTRSLSLSAPMTGNSRVMRKDSIRNRPMEISTRIITMAEISDTLKSADKILTADHFCHRACDQGEVHHGTADRDRQHKRGNKKLAQCRRRQYTHGAITAFDEFVRNHPCNVQSWWRVRECWKYYDPLHPAHVSLHASAASCVLKYCGVRVQAVRCALMALSWALTIDL